MIKQAILFDLDGTLVNSLADICAILNEVRALRGLAALPQGSIRSYIGKGVEHLIQGSFPELGEGQVPSLIQDYRELYFRHPHATGTVYPGVEEVLRQLRPVPGLALGIVTNKPTRIAERTLAHYLPGQTFEVIAGPETVSRRKPDPAHLLEVLARWRLSPKAAVFVGDDPVDEQCARAAGVRFFGAAYGFGGVSVAPESRLDAFAELLVKLHGWVAIAGPGKV